MQFSQEGEVFFVNGNGEWGRGDPELSEAKSWALGAHAGVLQWASKNRSQVFILNGLERFEGGRFGPVGWVEKRSHAA